MEEYNKKNIIKTYFSILVLDSNGDIYDEIFKNEYNKPFQDLKEVVKRIIDMKKTDKELGKTYGVWSYRIGKHEEDQYNDWQTVYKLRKYKNKYKLIIDDNF